MAAELVAGAALVAAGVLLIALRRGVADFRRELIRREQNPHHGLLNIERGQREQDLYKGPAGPAERFGVAALGAFLIVLGGWVVVQAL
jgi:hypothetical protein